MCKKLPQTEVEMSYIEYEVNFLTLFFVQNLKISMYVQNLHHFNFSFWECNTVEPHPVDTPPLWTLSVICGSTVGYR